MKALKKKELQEKLDRIGQEGGIDFGEDGELIHRLHWVDFELWSQI